MGHTFKLDRGYSALVVIDVQEKLLPAIHDWESVLAATVNMVKFAKTLNVPIVVTEQYPRGLGPTHGDIASLIEPWHPLEKTTFSCFATAGFETKLNAAAAKSLVIVGIEAHICVNQTALDALKRGYNVHIVTDAVGSRSPQNKEIGLAKMRQAGAVISSSEIALYEWLERADSKEFKAILPLVK